MVNLEQIRARCAQDFWRNTHHEELRGLQARALLRMLCAMLLDGGLLATLAFAREESVSDRRSAAEEVMLAVGKHLANKECAVLPFSVNSVDEFIRILTGHPSTLLQQATTESLALLGYLKRFAPHQ